MATSMKHQIYFGIKWAFTSLFLVRASRFITIVILARLLAPEMFGIIAIATVIIDTLDLIGEFGFGAAYIQRQESNEQRDRLTANTTLCLTLAFNTFLFLSGMCLAPIIADFFKMEQLEKVLRVMFALFLLHPFSNVASVILRKQLEFAKHSFCEIISSFSYTIVSIPLAFMDFGVWSLVYGYIVSKIILMLLAIKLSGWSPRFEFSKNIAKELFAFGKFIWASTLFSAITKSMDKIILGRFMGASNLGFYSIALKLCKMPATQMSFLVNRITFPALSKVQYDNAMLMKGFIKTLSHVSIISIPLALGLLAISERFVLSVYGNKWEQAIPLIKVLAFYGMSVSLSSLTTPFFKAVGKPNILFYVNIFHYTLKILLLFLFIKYGTLGICYAILIPSLLSAAILFSLVSIIHQFPIQKILAPIFKAGLSSIAMFFIIKQFQQYIELISSFSEGILLLSDLIIGIVTYLFITFFINRSILIELKNTFIEVIFAKGKIIGTHLRQG